MARKYRTGEIDDKVFSGIRCNHRHTRSFIWLVLGLLTAGIGIGGNAANIPLIQNFPGISGLWGSQGLGPVFGSGASNALLGSGFIVANTALELGAIAGLTALTTVGIHKAFANHKYKKQIKVAEKHFTSELGNQANKNELLAEKEYNNTVNLVNSIILDNGSANIAEYARSDMSTSKNPIKKWWNLHKAIRYEDYNKKVISKLCEKIHYSLELRNHDWKDIKGRRLSNTEIEFREKEIQTIQAFLAKMSKCGTETGINPYVNTIVAKVKKYDKFDQKANKGKALGSEFKRSFELETISSHIPTDRTTERRESLQLLIDDTLNQGKYRAYVFETALRNNEDATKAENYKNNKYELTSNRRYTNEISRLREHSKDMIEDQANNVRRSATLLGSSEMYNDKIFDLYLEAVKTLGRIEGSEIKATEKYEQADKFLIRVKKQLEQLGLNRKTATELVEQIKVDASTASKLTDNISRKNKEATANANAIRRKRGQANADANIIKGKAIRAQRESSIITSLVGPALKNSNTIKNETARANIARQVAENAANEAEQLRDTTKEYLEDAKDSAKGAEQEREKARRSAQSAKAHRNNAKKSALAANDSAKEASNSARDAEQERARAKRVADEIEVIRDHYKQLLASLKGIEDNITDLKALPNKIKSLHAVLLEMATQISNNSEDINNLIQDNKALNKDINGLHLDVEACYTLLRNDLTWLIQALQVTETTNDEKYRRLFLRITNLESDVKQLTDTVKDHDNRIKELEDYNKETKQHVEQINQTIIKIRRDIKKTNMIILQTADPTEQIKELKQYVDKELEKYNKLIKSNKNADPHLMQELKQTQEDLIKTQEDLIKTQEELTYAQRDIENLKKDQTAQENDKRRREDNLGATHKSQNQKEDIKERKELLDEFERLATAIRLAETGEIEYPNYIPDWDELKEFNTIIPDLQGRTVGKRLTTSKKAKASLDSVRKLLQKYGDDLDVNNYSNMSIEELSSITAKMFIACELENSSHELS